MRSRVISSTGTTLGVMGGMVCMVGLLGCSLPSNPHTSVGFNPWSKTIEFYDSKDNEIEVSGLTYAKDSGDFKLDKLSIRNNASDVRRANVEQINAYTEQVKATTAMMQNMTASLASMVPYVRPPAVSGSLTLPGGIGGSFGSTPAPVPAPTPTPVVPDVVQPVTSRPTNP